ncbi:MAG: tail fiber domain-containing protein, partial [Candidatus Fonsibacter sp.]
MIEIVGTGGAYLYFTAPNVDYNGRIFYANASSTFNLRVGGVTTTVMQLSSANLQVNGTVVSTSDKRFKFNEKPLTNELDVINQLAPVAYDQTHDLVYQYTADTPQSHQCGFIAQSVQSIDELKHAVVGGQVGDDGKESIRALNYNA